MVVRVAVLAALLTAMALAWLLVPAWSRLRAARRVNQVREPGLSAGQPTVLFFTGEYCSDCRHRQKPALDRLRDAGPRGLRVVELDAARQGALVKRFGVLSLPSTVVLGRDGTVAAVNYGFAPEHQLAAQLASTGC
ncbi:MAG: TlpA family protein disulfide reductase [Candidatus Dormibacteria bacterium]